jgi:glycosyltransferase involved in cell wall biosynthesis
MRLLIVIPAQDRATGNWTTASRLQQGMTARGHAVAIHATTGDAAALTAAIAATKPDLALLLHAWRSGRPWLETGSTLPFVVLLTGTDVNINLHDPALAPVIETVLAQAAAILSQNPLTVAALRSDRPALTARVHHLPPGIVLGTAPFPLRDRLALAPGELLLLCPAGIRPVKGVLELMGLCDPLVAAGCRLRLAFCGPLLDADYGRRFLEAVAARPWTAWLGTVPPEAMPAALSQADVIVSNAFSEGLPNALVEATVLGRPILARDIPGNAAVVTDGGNGLLYRNEREFAATLQRLHDDPALRTTLSQPAPERFSPEREAASLQQICAHILADTPSPRMC